MKKKIIYGEEARNKLKAGVDKIARAVVTTLGPKGRNVAFETAWRKPKVVNDGVTVAKEVELEDDFEDMGAQLAVEAAEKTNDRAGDGTTTAMLLTQAIVTEGLRNVSAGTNPMVLKKGLEEATDKVVKEIEKIAIKISTKEEKQQVATISARDEEVGELIAEAMEQVGDDGVIAIEDGKGFDIELEYKDGIQFDRGFASPYFITNPAKMEAVIEDASLLFIEDKVDDVQQLVVILENLVNTTKNIVIISEDFDANVLATLVMNKVRGVAKLLAVKAPEVGIRRTNLLEDMATVTGGQVISKTKGREIESIVVEDLGKADKVVSTKDETIIIGGKGKKKDINLRTKLIKKQLKESSTDFDEMKLEKRLAMISSGIAVLNVGAPSETEQKEVKLRVEDAVNATKAAVQEGIVPGGGVTLLNARKVIDKNKDIGHQIIFHALKYPISKILENAGLEPGEIIAGIDDGVRGYDVMEMKYVDMMEAGIIDPAKVVRSALQNAVSVAIMILTTDCLIVETKEEKEKKRPIPKLDAPRLN